MPGPWRRRPSAVPNAPRRRRELPTSPAGRRRRLRIESLEPRYLLAAGPKNIGDSLESDIASTTGPDTELIFWKDRLAEVYRNQWIVHLDRDAAAVDAADRSETHSSDNPIAASEQRSYHPLPTRILNETESSIQYFYAFTDGMVRDATLYAFARTPGFQLVEPNFVVRVDAVPDDPALPELWGLDNSSDADIDALEAWDLTTGSSSLVVGVIDTGVDYMHEDLVSNIWYNPNECPAGVGNCLADGVDDDGNGYVDDFYGWDFINDDNDPFDDHSHGTHVAGTIAAAGDNAVGVVGVTWNTKIMPLKFLGSGGTGATVDAVEAIKYATMMKRDHGVNIRLTNNSWGGGAYSQTLVDAIEDSLLEDMLFVAAAGNDGRNNETTSYFPASYDHDNIISVASTTRTDGLSSFSNYGLASVDLGAPGSSIYSTIPRNQYGYKSGTSMASPHVSGVAALAWSTDPNASYEEIRDVILGGVDPVPSLDAKTVTGGRLNAQATLQQMGLFATMASPAENEIVSIAPKEFTIDFSDPVDLASLDGSDLIVGGVAADAFAMLDPDSVEFSFTTSPVTVEGPQTVAVSAGSISRASDGDGVASLATGFYYDPTPLHVVSLTPADGSLLTLPRPVLRLDFSEDVAPGSLGLNDLTLSNGRVDRVTMIDGDTAEYELTGLDREVPLQVSLEMGAVTDPVGIPNQALTANYLLDFVEADHPAAWTAVAPLGSQVYHSSLEGNWYNASDLESLAIELEAGQVLTAVLTPDPDDTTGNLTGRLEVIDPLGAEVFSQSGTSVSGTAPQAIVMQTEPVEIAGRWTIIPESVGSTGGRYRLDLTLGAAIEEESLGLGTNDLQAAAQNLSAGLTPLDPGSSRNAVGGTIATVTDTDWFEVSLTAGQSNTLVLQSADASWPLAFSLHAADGSEVASGTGSVGAMRIDNLVVDQSGPYSIQIRAGDVQPGNFSGPASYALAIIRRATLDQDGVGTDANGVLATAQYLGNSLRAGGYVGQLAAASVTDDASSLTAQFDASALTEIAEGRFLPSSWLVGADIVEQEGQTIVSFSSPQDPRVLAGQQRVSENFISINSDPEGDFIRDVVYTPDGTRVLMAHRESNNVLVINVATGAIEADIAVSGQPVDLEVTADGTYALSANSSGNTVSIIDLMTMSKVGEITTTGNWPYRVRATPDGAHAVVATADDEFSVISLATLEEVRTFYSPGLGIVLWWFSTGPSGRMGFRYTDFVITPDSAKIITPATTAAGNSARIYDLSSGGLLADIPVPGKRPSITITDDAVTVYATSNGYDTDDATITRIDVATGAATQTATTERLFAYQTLLTPDDRYIVARGLNDTLFIDVTDGSTSATLNTISHLPQAAFTYDGQYLLARQVIDVATQTIVESLPQFNWHDFVATSPTELAGVQAGSTFGDLYRFVSITDGVARAGADLSAGSAPEADTPYEVDITPDGLRAVTVNYDSGNVSIVDLQAESVLAWIDVGTQPDNVVITPDGTMALVTSLVGNSLTLVDLASYSVVTTLTEITERPLDVVISSDGSQAYLLTTGNVTDKVYFIQLNGPATSVVGSLDVGDAGYSGYHRRLMALSPDGNTLAVPVSRDDEVVLVDTATRAELARLSTDSFPEPAVFSPDGDLLYVLSRNGESITVIRVDGVDSAVVGQVPGLSSPIGLAIDDRGQYLYVTSQDEQVVYVVDAKSQSLVASVPIQSPAEVRGLLLIDRVLYLVGSEGVRLRVPLNDDTGHVMRVYADGPDSHFIDDTLLNGRSHRIAYSESLRSIAAVSFDNDGIDLIEYASIASGDEDVYRFFPQVGDNIAVTATVPGTASGLFDNELDIAVELYDPQGQMLAESDGEPITHTATANGEYFVRVFAQNLTRGEYTVAITGVTQLARPSLVALSPGDDETDVVSDSAMQMRFDRPVVASSGTIWIYRASDGVLFESFEATSPGVVIEGATVTVSPTMPWQRDTEYYVLIDADAFEDDFGGRFEGINDPAQWNFFIGRGYDFGDAPPPYPVAAADGGPRHALRGPILGDHGDNDLDGNASADADGDDTTGAIDDEDGVGPGVIQVGDVSAQLTVHVTSADEARLDAWIDFNRDGIWDSAHEQIAISAIVADGENTLTFAVPAWVHPGETIARFRISTAGDLGVTGDAVDGEIEDHKITIVPPAEASAHFTGVNLLLDRHFAHGSFSAGDIDADGDTDLVAGFGTAGRLVWFENESSLGFTEIEIADRQSRVSVVDIDSDGDLDIVALSFLKDELSWFENNGNGRFEAYQIEQFSSDNELTDIETLDFDGDNDVDLIVSDCRGDSIYLYENDGRQAFARSLLLSDTEACLASVADLDSDGDFDLVTGAIEARKHENTPSGWVTTPISSASPRDLELTDLDGDGDLDLVTTELRGILWRRNVGGTFQEPIDVATSTKVQRTNVVRGADLDGDGDMDLVGNGPDRRDELAWYQNDGSQNFTRSVIVPDGYYPANMVVLDYDGDGDLDIATASVVDGFGLIENINGEPPQIASLSPPAGAAVVDTQTDLAIVFDQPVLAGDGEVTIWDLTNNVAFEEIDLGSSRVTIVDNVVTIDPATVFAPATTYEVRIGPGALRDSDGDVFAGILGGQWQFESADAGIDFGDLAGPSASHVITPGLYLGTFVDGEDGSVQNAWANADDGVGMRDDEDGLLDPATDLQLVTGAQPTVTVLVTNLTADPATLTGWIDYDGDGIFAAGESSSVDVPTGANHQRVTLTFPAVPQDIVPTSYARFRLGSDPSSLVPVGASVAGEVEDYLVTILRPGLAAASAASTIADDHNGGPSLVDYDQYGASVAAIGDVDGDGVIDIAVGAPNDSASEVRAGAVYVHLMNVDGTVKRTQKLSGTLASLPVFFVDKFGSSLAAVGDLDFDGVPDLVATAPGRWVIHQLYLNQDGTLKDHRIAEYFNIEGEPEWSISSIASIGDLDADGVTDFAIGMDNNLQGGDRRGAVFIKFANADGSTKAVQRISNEIGGGPPLPPNARFGASVTSLGDVDGDHVPDLAVSASRIPSSAGTYGAVFILMMNPDGTVKSYRTIDGQGPNEPPVLLFGDFGSTVAAIGDRNADGVMDLAIGSQWHRDGTGRSGKIDIVLLNGDGSVKSYQTITEGSGPVAGLANDDYFGSSIAAIGDLNLDGQMDLAVGAIGDDGGGTDRGAVHILMLDDRPPTDTVSIDGSDNLVITNLGDGSTRTIQASDTHIIFRGPNARISTTIPTASGGSTHAVSIPLAAFTGNIVFDAGDGDDTLTIDTSLGNFDRTITYNSGPGSDQLQLAGGAFADATYAMSNSSEGSIDLTGNSTLAYFGLERITAEIDAAHVVVNHSPLGETIAVADAGSGRTTVTSTAGPLLTFRDPTASLKIDAGDAGIDTINVEGLAAGYPANVTIEGGWGDDSVHINGPISLDAADLTIDADRISVAEAVDTGGGKLSLTASGDITLGFQSVVGSPVGSISTEGGAISIVADTIQLRGTVEGTGTLSLAPSQPTSTIGIGGGSGRFNIDDAELAHLSDGFGSITIGDSSVGVGRVNVDTATFTDPVTVVGGTINDMTGTDIMAPLVALGGIVSPGQSPGVLEIDGNAALPNGSVLNIEIDGELGVGITGGHDQLNATGSVDILDSVSLTFAGAPVLSGSGGLTIVVRTGGSGIFDGVPEGHVFTNFLGSTHDYRITYAGGDGDDIVLVPLPAPPVVQSVIINAGDAQRSGVTRAAVTFSEVVEIDLSAGDVFQFFNQDTDQLVTEIPSVSEVDGKTVVEFTFAPGPSVNAVGGLLDGDYLLTIDASRVTFQTVKLDGNADGTAGDDYVFGATAADNFFRKYGDHNGNGLVDLLDFAQLRRAFGKSWGESGYIEGLDYEGDNLIGLLDFTAFRRNFGT